MSHLVTSNASSLEVLYSADPKQRKALLKTMTENQQQALCEVILNVYKGTFPLSKYYIRRLSPYHHSETEQQDGEEECQAETIATETCNTADFDQTLFEGT